MQQEAGHAALVVASGVGDQGGRPAPQGPTGGARRPRGRWRTPRPGRRRPEPRRTRSDLATLRTTIKALDRADGLAAFRLTDSRFHGGLAPAARSLPRENAIPSAQGGLFGPHDLLSYQEPVVQPRIDHQAIDNAVRHHDPAAPQARMREHIERTREQLRIVIFGWDGQE